MGFRGSGFGVRTWPLDVSRQNRAELRCGYSCGEVMSNTSETRGPVVAPCIACGASLKEVPEGQPCAACGTPWTSPTLRFFWRVQVIGVVLIPLMFLGGAVWMAQADSEHMDAPGLFLLVTFILAVAHLLAGVIWNTTVPDYHRPRGTGKIMALMFVVLLIVGIFMPALGKC